MLLLLGARAASHHRKRQLNLHQGRKKTRQLLHPQAKPLDLHADPGFMWYQFCSSQLSALQKDLQKKNKKQQIFWRSASVWWELWWDPGEGWVPLSCWELRWGKRASSLCDKLDQRGLKFGPWQGLREGGSCWVPLSPARGSALPAAVGITGSDGTGTFWFVCWNKHWDTMLIKIRVQGYHILCPALTSGLDPNLATFRH